MGKKGGILEIGGAREEEREDGRFLEELASWRRC